MGKKSKRKCIECASQINEDAIVCVNCKAYQNWRRFIPMGNTSLALIIAFISVLTMSFDKMILIHKNFFADKEKAIFYLTVNAADGNEAIITIKNTGDSDIILPTTLICFIPMVDDPSFTDNLYSNPINVRNPYKKEISRVVGVAYNDKQLINNIVLKSNEARRLVYTITDRWVNNDKQESERGDLYPLLKDEDTVKGNCFITIQDVLSRDYWNGYEIDALHVMLFQEEFKTNSYFNNLKDKEKLEQI